MESTNRVWKWKQKKETLGGVPAKVSVVSAVRCCPFGDVSASSTIVFAAVNGNTLSVYALDPTNGGPTLLHSFIDEAWDEQYYCLEWFVIPDSSLPDLNEQHVISVAIAGELGVIKVVSLFPSVRSIPSSSESIESRMMSDASLITDATMEEKESDDRASKLAFTPRLQCSVKAHGGSVNSIRRMPKKLHCALTSSDDGSLRLWDLVTQRCLSMLSVGHCAHRSYVQSGSLSLCGQWCISGAMDSLIKVWKIPDDLHSSRNVSLVQIPRFSKRKIHSDFVIAVDFISKSLVVSQSLYSSELIIWKLPNTVFNPDERNEFADVECVCESATVIAKLGYSPNHLTDSESGVKKQPKNVKRQICRFALSENRRVLAVGNDEGKVFVWDIPVYLKHYSKDERDDQSASAGTPGLRIVNFGSEQPVTSVGLSCDGSSLFVGFGSNLLSVSLFVQKEKT